MPLSRVLSLKACLLRGRARVYYGLALLGLTFCGALHGEILWSDLRAALVKETGAGTDILGGVIKRDDTASDTLYFKFHVDPLSDAGTEPYFAAFQFYEGNAERLGIGNALAAWAYSAFKTSSMGESNAVQGEFDFHSARVGPIEPGFSPSYERPHRGIPCTIAFKVQYVPGADDQVTVWLNPDLGPGATETSQPAKLVTHFPANASFDAIHLRHGGGGDGWIFSDMAIATSFSDFVNSANGDAAARANLPYTFRTWQREQGLPQNSVHALAQTSEGYIWIGSDDGVARFDGVRFVSFGLREGLRSGRVRVLLSTADGSLWIGTLGGGVTRLHEGQFTTWTLADSLPSDSITALAEDGEHRVWIGTEAGLIIWQNGHLAPLPAASDFRGKTVTAIGPGAKGSMWLALAGSGVFHYQSSRFDQLNDSIMESLLSDAHSLLEDARGRLWIGTGNDFVLCHEGSDWRRYRIARRLVRPFVGSLSIQTNGTVWAGSIGEGLFQFQEGKLSSITTTNGLADNAIEALLVDNENNLWVGTSAGLTRLRRSGVAVLSQNEGLGYGPVQGLAEAGPGMIWAGKSTDGLYAWSGTKFARLCADLFPQNPQVNALLTSREGDCWVGWAQGLVHFPNPQAGIPETNEFSFFGQNVVALAEARDGVLWAGTREGELWCRRGGAWSAQANFPRDHAITGIIEDVDGRAMWIGTEGGGLYRFTDSVQARLGKHNGLLSDLVRALYLDSQGTLWIGTAGGGLARRSPQGRVTTFTTHEGLPDNTISQILEDDSGRLWLGSNRGLACVSKHQLDELAAGKNSAVYPQVFGRSEGMASEECTGGFCPAGLKTRSGQLWFSTLKGIVVTDPRPSTQEGPPPPVLLEEVGVDGALFPVAAGKPEPVLHLAPGPHRLEFNYTGLNFAAPERVRFRYRLENLDSDWVDAATRRTAYYPYVPAGEYRFHVTACNSAGIWNPAGTSLVLVVAPHWWQTWWFRAVAGLALLGSVGGMARLAEKRRLQRQLQHLEEERSLERERARIAQDLHDELGASLTRISLLSDLVKADRESPVQVETHASKISLSAAQTVRALEEIVWALRPGSDTLQSLIEYIAHFATELFDGDQARSRLDLQHDLPAASLPPEMRHNIFLIVKEALTNALKHAGAKEVHVQAKASDRSLEISVRDDGIGFEPPLKPHAGKRHGLGNMQRRAEAMGATLNLQSAPGNGTTVRLVVSLSNW